MSLIELDAVSLRYPGAALAAVDAVSLRVEAGEYLAIIGANGSGKSSLLRLIAGLKAPSSGSARVLGLEASAPENLHRVRSELALVFQSPLDQIVSTVVEEDVAFGPENLGLPRAEIARRVESALLAVGLLEERRKPSLFLSAGQQQRLALAGALAMGPACIAFDEASSMLDPPSRNSLLDLMDELKAQGKALIHVTHDMGEAARADRVIVLAAGRIVFEGRPEELFEEGRGGAEPAALALGFDLPPSAAAARALGLPPRLRESAQALATRLARRHKFRPGSQAEAARPESVSAAGVAAEKARAERAIAEKARASDPAASVAVAASGSPPAAFELDAVSFSYLRGTIEEALAVDGVSLKIPKGGSLALVGRTGSGKSSVLQLLDALASPCSGRVLAFGLDTKAASTDLAALRVRAPLAIQRPESALFEAFAGDDVSFGPRNIGLKGKELVERTSRWMEALGLPFAEFRDRQTRSLSGGEKRRLALAGVFALEPEALLLDEPTQALDPPTRASILDLLSARRAAGTTVVLATHSMEEAAASSLVAVFGKGRLLAFGPPRRIFYEDYDPAWGIGRPFVCELALALEAEGLPLTGPSARPLDLSELAASFAAAIGASRRSGGRLAEMQRPLALDAKEVP